MMKDPLGALLQPPDPVSWSCASTQGPIYILTLVYRFLLHLTSFHGSTPDQYWKGLTDQYIIQCNSEYSTQWPEWPLRTSGHCPGGCSTLKGIQPSHKISERIISHFKIIQQCNYTNLQTQNQLAKYAEFPLFFPSVLLHILVNNIGNHMKWDLK